MPQATALWSLWRRLLQPFACIFTRPGHRRFVEWVTALARNVEEHTVTQSAVAVERLGDWRAWERFAASGAWDPAAVTRRLTRAVEEAPGRTWHGDHVWAGDDTKVHRSGQHVWGTCTFHEDTARGPNPATTVRAHHGVVRGAPRDHGERPAWFLPLSGRLSFRQSQLPARSGVAGPKEVFRTRCERAGALVRERARISGGRHLAVFDGGSALKSVVRPPVVPEEGPPRVESLTRSRHDARLQAPPPKERRPGQRGPTPRWGKRRPPPRQGGWWKKGWQEGRSSI